MNVQDVMTRSPRTCRGSDSLVSAAKVLWDNDCGAVPVVDDGGRPIGIVTDRDCCMAAYTRGLRLDEIPVAAAMARSLFTVRADEPLSAAVATMQQKQVRRLPVVDGQGKLCGIVSAADLLVRGKGHAGVFEALAAIAAPRKPAASPEPGKREPASVVVPKAPPVAVAPPAPAPAVTAANASASSDGKGKKNGKKK